MKRKGFLLIFNEEPASADVVREDLNVGVNPQTLTESSKCRFRWESKRDTFVTVEGTVVKTGLKKDLVCLKVDKNGKLSNTGVGTRKQEVEKDRMRQKYALEHHMQDVAQQIVEDGADAVAAQLKPVERARKSTAPKRRSSEELSKLKKLVDEMSCFRNGPLKTDLVPGRGVYVSSCKLSTALLTYKRQPKLLFQSILRMTVSKKVCLADGFSSTGKRGCVGIPASVIDTITYYVSGVYSKYKNKDNNQFNRFEDYSPWAIFTNLINNTRKLEAKKRALLNEVNEGQQDDEDVLDEEGLLDDENPEDVVPTQDHEMETTTQDPPSVQGDMPMDSELMEGILAGMGDSADDTSLIGLQEEEIAGSSPNHDHAYTFTHLTDISLSTHRLVATSSTTNNLPFGRF